MEKPVFYVIKKLDLSEFMDLLLRHYSVFAPVESEGEHNFRRIRSWGDADLRRYVNTEFPPKKFFHPDGLTIMEFSGGKVRESKGAEKIIIFGVRPCDTHALDVLDRVMTGGYLDHYYKNRRDSALIFALNCAQAGENCFCGSMGTSEATGFDLLFTDAGSEFHVETGSERGRKLAEKSGLFRRTEKAAAKAKLKFRKAINTENLGEVMRSSFSGGFWEETAKRCVSCASCTNVCPTCYCFDVNHENSLGDKKVKITRTWSYCMLRPFTRIAGDKFTRDSRTERVKQFFYHKLLYGVENQEKLHCVGCGRCIRECMTHIDITEEAAKARVEYERGKNEK